MSEDRREPPTSGEVEKKGLFVLSQATARLDATISAIDSLTSRATNLMAIAAAVFTGMLAIVPPIAGTPAFWGAMAGFGLLGAAIRMFWRVIRIRRLKHGGRLPSEFLKPCVMEKTLGKLYLEECHFYEAAIRENEEAIERTAAELRLGMALFIAAPLACLIVTAVCSTFQPAERQSAVMAPRIGPAGVSEDLCPRRWRRG